MFKSTYDARTILSHDIAAIRMLDRNYAAGNGYTFEEWKRERAELVASANAARVYLQREMPHIVWVDASAMDTDTVKREAMRVRLDSITTA